MERKPPDNLRECYMTQVWRAEGIGPASQVTGEFFLHRASESRVHADVRSTSAQDRLLEAARGAPERALAEHGSPAGDACGLCSRRMSSGTRRHKRQQRGKNQHGGADHEGSAVPGRVEQQPAKG